ncbi:MAG: EAL domain-containing protein [Thiotrichales bacterium]
MADSLRVVVADNNPNHAHNLINGIKSLGYVVRSEIVDSKDALQQELNKAPVDFILHHMEYEGLPLDQVYRAIRNQDQRPVLIALADSDQIKPAEVMKSGAADLVRYDDIEHLQQVIKRSLKTHNDGKTLAHIKSNFADLEKLYATLMEAYEAPVAYLHEGIHVHANSAYFDLFQLTGDDDIEGVPLMDLLPVSEQPQFKAFLQQYKRGEGELLDSGLHIEINGEDYALEMADVYYESEPCQQLLFRKVSNHGDTSQLTEQLSYLAIYDIASGLYTRNHLFAQLERAISRASQDGEKSTLIMLSLDNYNALASGLGMAEADMLYAEIGTELKAQLDLDDILCRYDAQTFCLLTNAHGKAENQHLIRQLIDSINDHLFEVNGKSVPCQLSAGMVIIDENATSEFQIISSALEALRKANLKGIDFDSELNAQEIKPQKILDHEWTEQLRLSLKEGSFRLFYQPVASLTEEPGRYFSVSIRIAKSGGGYIYPGEFLPSAERTGYAKGIDRWVIMNALRKLAENTNESSHPVLFIKLTQGTLYYEEDISWIRKKIEETAVDGNQLVFEFSTTLLMNHLQQTQALIEDLSPLGCHFSVDDFGDALNPFQLLKHVKVDYLKLHSSLMDELSRSDETQQLVHHLIERAHQQEQKVIAPEISDGNQLFLLNNLGADLAQGDFLHQAGESLDYEAHFED